MITMDFSSVANTFDILESKSGRIEMAERFAELLKKTSLDEIKHLIYISTGILAPPYYSIELGLGEQFGIRAIADAYGYSINVVSKMFDKLGDLGKTAEYFCTNKKQSTLFPSKLTLEHVYDTFVKIAKTSGKGSQDLKIKLLIELLSNAEPNEAKFIIRFVLGELRLGIRESTIIDALSMAKFEDKSYHDILDRAFNITSDLGYVAELFMKDPKSVETLKVEPFKPLMPALAERLPTAEQIMEKMGGICAAESKYDGMRMQIHRKDDRVEIYSRRLEVLTHMFPDVVSAVKRLNANIKEIIFEGESLAYDKEENRFYSFQETMHRRRKHQIGKISKELPMYVFAFDIMFFNGKDLTNRPYKERRKLLESLFPNALSANEKFVIRCSEKHIVKTASQLESVFKNAISRGLEGTMAKDLNAPYTAGKRKFAWIKLKKSYGASMDTIDGVIVGYYLGKGHRTEFGLGGVLLAVYSESTGMLETVAKVGSGFSEEEMKKLKSDLEKLKMDEPDYRLSIKDKKLADVWVRPKIIVEVAFDNITISSMHTCCEKNGKGYALRFPRIVRFRNDKSLDEITTSEEVKEMFERQK